MQNNLDYMQIKFKGYVNINSFIHSIDPRIKLLLALLILIVTLVLDNLLSLLVIFVFVFILIYLSRVGFKYVYSPIIPLIPFLCLVVILRLLSTYQTADNTPIIFSFWRFKITELSLKDSIILIFRFFTVYSFFVMLISTTSAVEFIKGLENLLIPFQKFGFPSNELVMVVNISLRFFNLITVEMNRIIKAQVSRGADFTVKKFNFIKKLKLMMPLFIPLFVFSFEHTKALTESLEARCYRGGKGRSYYKRLKLKMADLYMIIGFSITFCIAFLVKILIKNSGILFI